jgi:hypothetical protein
MAQDNREKPSVKTTIVGGRPPGSGKEADAVPRGIEILLKKASIDESFRKMFLSDRLKAAGTIGLTLNPAEVAVLKAIPEPSLERMVAATKVQPKIRHAFMGYAATVMLAALTAASEGMPQDSAQASRGIQPDAVQDEKYYVTIGGASGIAEMLAALYGAEAYMRIAPQDEKAPRGNLEVTIANWGLRQHGVFKIHLTKIESSAPSESSRTEGLGYAIDGQFLQEKIPVGEYLVDIGFADKAYVRSKKIAVKEKETAKINFKVNFRRGATGTIAGLIVIVDEMLDIE